MRGLQARSIGRFPVTVVAISSVTVLADGASAARLIEVQSVPEPLRPLIDFAYLGLIGVISLLVLLHLARGRIDIDGGWAGDRVLIRFGRTERWMHWLTALAFVAATVTGATAMYGHLLAWAIPLPRVPSLHRWAAFGYLAAWLVLVVMWARHALPSRYDRHWVSAGGMVLGQRKKPPATMFNATQKMMFWLLTLAGVLSAATGFGWLPLPTGMAALLHLAAGTAMIAAVLGHIYFRTVGIEGALDAMRSGEVDLNWAKQHHAIWAEHELVKGERARRSSMG